MRILSQAPVVMVGKGIKDKILYSAPIEVICGYNPLVVGLTPRAATFLKGAPSHRPFVLAQYGRHYDDGRIDPAYCQQRPRDVQILALKTVDAAEFREQPWADAVRSHTHDRTILYLLARYPLDYFHPLDERELVQLIRELIATGKKPTEKEKKEALHAFCRRYSKSPSMAVSRDCLLELMQQTDGDESLQRNVDSAIVDHCRKRYASGTAYYEAEWDFRTRFLAEYAIHRSDRAGIDLLFVAAHNCLNVFPAHEHTLNSILHRLEELSHLGLEPAKQALWKLQLPEARLRNLLSKYEAWWNEASDSWK